MRGWAGSVVVVGFAIAACRSFSDETPNPDAGGDAASADGGGVESGGEGGNDSGPISSAAEPPCGTEGVFCADFDGSGPVNTGFEQFASPAGTTMNTDSTFFVSSPKSLLVEVPAPITAGPVLTKQLVANPARRLVVAFSMRRTASGNNVTATFGQISFKQAAASRYFNFTLSNNLTINESGQGLEAKGGAPAIAEWHRVRYEIDLHGATPQASIFVDDELRITGGLPGSTEAANGVEVDLGAKSVTWPVSGATGSWRTSFDKVVIGALP